MLFIIHKLFASWSFAWPGIRRENLSSIQYENMLERDHSTG